jgi:omptin
VAFTGSYGLTSIKANEYVYQRKIKVSQLVWQSQYVSTLNGAVKIELPANWYLDARGTIGLGGDGHMADFDWLQPGGAWSDRSRHPDTRLDHYFVASLEVGRILASHAGTDIGLGAGLKYTDIQWSAWGGSFVYSDRGFRNVRGHFDPNEKGISYRQTWPAPYLGLNLNHQRGRWVFSGALRGGIAIDADDIDDHWARNLRFHDHMKTTPTVSIASSINYTVWNNASLYLGGSFDKIFRVRADTASINTVTGVQHWQRNDAGADYRAATVSFGLRGQF